MMNTFFTSLILKLFPGSYDFIRWFVALKYRSDCGVTTQVGWFSGIVRCLTVGNEIYNLGL